jgi:hypothetical protein
MRMLEARFHPRRRSRPEVETVGHLVWKTDEPRARPLFEPARKVPPSVVSKLNYLIAIAGPDYFERLQALRSDFWSFVPIADDERSSEG